MSLKNGELEDLGIVGFLAVSAKSVEPSIMDTVFRKKIKLHYGAKQSFTNRPK